MRPLAFLLTAALLVQACSATTPPTGFLPSVPQVALTGSPGTIDDFSIQTVGMDNGTPVTPLFELPAIPTNQGQLGLTVWGETDAGGNVTSATEAEVSGLGGGADSVHVFFDPSSRPVLFVDDATGYSFAVSSITATQATITLCDPGGTPDAYTVLTVENGQSSLSAIASGGTCALTGLVTASRPAGGKRDSGSRFVNLSSLENLEQWFISGSYAASFGAAANALEKFEQHKDDPTQIPNETTFMALVIAAALLIVPALLGLTGWTVKDLNAPVAVDGLVPLYEPSAP